MKSIVKEYKPKRTPSESEKWIWKLLRIVLNVEWVDGGEEVGGTVGGKR